MKDDDNATIQVSSHGKWWCQNNIQILEGQVERLQERVNALQMTAEEGREIYGERFAALERATPAREADGDEVSLWERRFWDMKATAERAERELDEAGRQVDHVMRSISRVERERDEAYEKLTQNVREHYPPAFRILCAERDAAHASAEKLREALEEITWTSDGYGSLKAGDLRRVAQAALDQAGDLAHAPSGDRA